MAQVYLIARRAEVQNGSVMVTDLFPNESQRNTAIDPVGAGPIYVRQVDLGVKGKYRAILSTTANVITFAVVLRIALYFPFTPRSTCLT